MSIDQLTFLSFYSVRSPHRLPLDLSKIKMMKDLFKGLGVLFVFMTSLTNAQEGADDWGPTPSPDGSKIAFYSTRNGKQFGRIFIMNANGSGLKELQYPNTGGHDVEPSWSPDGTKIVFTSQKNFNEGSVSSAIYIMNANGTNLRKLYDHDGDGDGATHFGDWIDDGRRFVFFYWKYGGFEPNIYTINLDGTNLRQLTFDKASYQPSVLNGHIWFTSKKSEDPIKYRMDLNGQHVTQVEDLIGWSPTYGIIGDSSYYFCITNDRNGTASFYRLDEKMRVENVLEIDHHPAYFVDVSESQQYFVYNKLGKKNHDIYRLDIQTGESVPLLEDN